MCKSFIIFLAVLVSLVPISAFAGTLEPAAGPAVTNSYSLEDVYNRLDTGEAGAPKAFAEPTAGPAATGYTIDQLMEKMPAKDAVNGAAAGNVLEGKTFWGLGEGEAWGSPQTGTMKAFIGTGEAVTTYSPGAADKTIDTGFHDGSVVKGDADLVPGNIGAGVDIFGVTGTAKLSTGDATPAQVLNGATFSNAGGPATGSMPNSTGEYTPKATEQDIAIGYHDGSTIKGDPNLVQTNILNGVTIFGVSGSIPNYSGEAAKSYTPTSKDESIDTGFHDGSVVKGDVNLISENIVTGKIIFGVTGNASLGSGAAMPADVLIGVTYSNSSGASVGTMPKHGAITYTPTNKDQPIDTGYHEGSIIQGDINLLPGNIIKDKIIFGVTGTIIKADGDATNEKVLEGITYSNAIGTSTGTMPNYSGIKAITYTPTTQDQDIARGYHDSSVVKGEPNLLPENILKGKNIFGQEGTVIKAEGDAVDALVLSGTTYSNKNGPSTGAMPNYSGAEIKTYMPKTTDTIIDRGYHLGSILKGDPNLLAKNIMAGVSIFGIKGSYNCTTTNPSPIGIWVTSQKWEPGFDTDRARADEIIASDTNIPPGYDNHYALISFPAGDTITMIPTNKPDMPKNVPIVRVNSNGEITRVIADNWGHFIGNDLREWYNPISDTDSLAWTGMTDGTENCNNWGSYNLDDNGGTHNLTWTYLVPPDPDSPEPPLTRVNSCSIALPLIVISW